jgi:hypothetical protein
VHLLVELFDDGGIRVTPPDGRAGMATTAELLKWVRAATAAGQDVVVHGRLASPLVTALVARIEEVDARVTVEESEPAPWRKGWTSLMWAAEHGLLAETVDLLERGSSPDAPRRIGTPYRLAMRRGHVPVMKALRDAGAEDPVLPRPPGAPDAIVMRMYVGALLWWWIAPIAPVVGIVVAIATQSLLALLVGLLLGAIVVVMGVVGDYLAGRSTVAVDGPRLFSRRFWRWRQPVDLRQLSAIGLRESGHRRTPTLLRLANPDVGEPIGRRTTHAGLDGAIVEQLRAQPRMHVLTIYLGWNYLRPGLERYVASFVDPRRTLVSTTAQSLVDDAGRT